MKKFLFLIFIIFLTACTPTNQDFIIINNKKIKVEIADTAESRYQGLSSRESICADCGMLFVFKDRKERAFVMRDMEFGLDIIWIDGERVVKIDKNLAPEGPEPKNKYSSGQAVDYVLEVNAGLADKNNIKVGDRVNF